MLPKFRLGVTGTLGAAATAGKLLGLSEDQLVSALGLRGIFSSVLGRGSCRGPWM